MGPDGVTEAIDKLVFRDAAAREVRMSDMAGRPRLVVFLRHLT